MSWRNVRLIYAREIRDQLRDRRTLFMIAVLPLLLYPLVGMSVFQLSQFLRRNESRILLVDSGQLAARGDLPPLVANGRFAEELLDDPADRQRLNLEFYDWPAPATDRPVGALLDAARGRLQAGTLDVVVYFPADFCDRLAELQTQFELAAADPATRAAKPVEIPEPELMFNSAREKSRLARGYVDRVLRNWKAQVVRQNLLAGRVPINVARPFVVKPLDVAERRQQEAAVWAKVLPFVLFIWALTGAFYPAVDLCAGEKERGTLETLLSSPALRGEIVWGKLLTVMTFSVATAALNLASLGLTAQYVVQQLNSLAPGEALGQINLPELSIVGYLAGALLPISALFSALCLACAAFARSSKEGQYYLMPLLVVMMPLMMLPMSPGIELNLGNSLIPVTGVVLLLRALVEGHAGDALPYVLPVGAVTAVCCLLAIRWAVHQFSRESVLFRESERLDLRRWAAHLVRDRQDTPTLDAALVCAALVFVVQFFVQLAISSHAPAEPGFRHVMLLVLASQVGCIALPALVMTLLLTRRPLKTLLLDRPPRWTTCAAAVALAVLLQPVGHHLQLWIQQLYPLQDGIQASTQAFARLLAAAPYVWLPFLLLAVLPAVCEEIAFRGFILSGLRRIGHNGWAILLSAVFFGMAHTVVQQSLVAVALGLVIGYLAVQSGSLIPGMLFHTLYNGLMLALALLPKQIGVWADHWPAVRLLLVEVEPAIFSYRWQFAIPSGIAGAAVLWWFHRLPSRARHDNQPTGARTLPAQALAVAPAFQPDAPDLSG